MAKRLSLPPEFERERRVDRVLARHVVNAIRRSDEFRFAIAAPRIGEEGFGDGWAFAFKQLARQPPRLGPEMRIAFFQVWTTNKPRRPGRPRVDDSLACDPGGKPPPRGRNAGGVR